MAKGNVATPSVESSLKADSTLTPSQSEEKKHRRNKINKLLQQQKAKWSLTKP